MLSRAKKQSQTPLVCFHGGRVRSGANVNGYRHSNKKQIIDTTIAGGLAMLSRATAAFGLNKYERSSALKGVTMAKSIWCLSNGQTRCLFFPYYGLAHRQEVCAHTLGVPRPSPTAKPGQKSSNCEDFHTSVELGQGYWRALDVAVKFATLRQEKEAKHVELRSHKEGIINFKPSLTYVGEIITCSRKFLLSWTLHSCSLPCIPKASFDNELSSAQIGDFKRGQICMPFRDEQGKCRGAAYADGGDDTNSSLEPVLPYPGAISHFTGTTDGAFFLSGLSTLQFASGHFTTVVAGSALVSTTSSQNLIKIRRRHGGSEGMPDKSVEKNGTQGGSNGTRGEWRSNEDDFSNASKPIVALFTTVVSATSRFAECNEIEYKCQTLTVSSTCTETHGTSAHREAKETIGTIRKLVINDRNATYDQGKDDAHRNASARARDDCEGSNISCTEAPPLWPENGKVMTLSFGSRFINMAFQTVSTQDGILVTELLLTPIHSDDDWFMPPGGNAAKNGVHRFDLIVEVNGRIVPCDMESTELAELLEELPRPVNIGFIRFDLSTLNHDNHDSGAEGYWGIEASVVALGNSIAVAKNADLSNWDADAWVDAAITDGAKDALWAILLGKEKEEIAQITVDEIQSVSTWAMEVFAKEETLKVFLHRVGLAKSAHSDSLASLGITSPVHLLELDNCQWNQTLECGSTHENEWEDPKDVIMLALKFPIIQGNAVRVYDAVDMTKNGGQDVSKHCILPTELLSTQQAHITRIIFGEGLLGLIFGSRTESLEGVFGLHAVVVAAGSSGDSKGVKVGDAVVEVNGCLLDGDTSDSKFTELLNALPRPVVVGFSRGGANFVSAAKNLSPIRTKTPQMPQNFIPIRAQKYNSFETHLSAEIECHTADHLPNETTATRQITETKRRAATQSTLNLDPESLLAIRTAMRSESAVALTNTAKEAKRAGAALFSGLELEGSAALAKAAVAAKRAQVALFPGVGSGGSAALAKAAEKAKRAEASLFSGGSHFGGSGGSAALAKATEEENNAVTGLFLGVGLGGSTAVVSKARCSVVSNVTASEVRHCGVDDVNNDGCVAHSEKTLERFLREGGFEAYSLTLDGVGVDGKAVLLDLDHEGWTDADIDELDKESMLLLSRSAAKWVQIAPTSLRNEANDKTQKDGEKKCKIDHKTVHTINHDKQLYLDDKSKRNDLIDRAFFWYGKRKAGCNVHRKPHAWIFKPTMCKREIDAMLPNEVKNPVSLKAAAAGELPHRYGTNDEGNERWHKIDRQTEEGFVSSCPHTWETQEWEDSRGQTTFTAFGV